MVDTTTIAWQKEYAKARIRLTAHVVTAHQREGPLLTTCHRCANLATPVKGFKELLKDRREANIRAKVLAVKS